MGQRRFEQMEREVYAKVGEPNLWLYINSKGNWLVGGTPGKDKRRTNSLGVGRSVASAGGLPPPAGPGRWQMHGDGSEWVEQTVQIRHG